MKKIYFITVLRVVAACLITNAHYEGVYPTDLIANGGLIGDIIFFAVSGFCLYNIKNDLSVNGFIEWYGRRIWRIYPPVIIITGFYMLIGAYKLSEHSVTWWYIYPTYYHFVASIIILYIPFFFIIKIDYLKNHLLKLMIMIAMIWMGVYLFIFDKSYYHIDSVRHPMIRFLFMESMLFGAFFRQNYKGFHKMNKPLNWMATLIVFVLYFVSKMMFLKYPEYSHFQFVNQIIIFVLLVLLFICFSGINDKLENLPNVIYSFISFISEMTLEIYVVQYVIIDLIVQRKEIHFPLNWIVITASIIGSAFVLHIICKCIYKAADSFILGIKER